jgi:hypothetical protein
MDSLAAAEPDRPDKRRSLLESTWVRAALLIATIEAVLIVTGVVPRWVAVAIALAVLAGYFVYARNVRNPSARQGVWAVAVSQGLVLFVPLTLWVLSAVAVVLLALVAAVVLVVLLRDR